MSISKFYSLQKTIYWSIHSDTLIYRILFSRYMYWNTSYALWYIDTSHFYYIAMYTQVAYIILEQNFKLTDLALPKKARFH